MSTLGKIIIEDEETINVFDDYKDYNLNSKITSHNYLSKYPMPQDSEVEYLSPNYISKTSSKPQDKFASLQQWIGTVINIDKEKFYANLYDGEKGIYEEAEFFISDISVQDLNLLKLGAVFYWSIGYLDKTSGQRLKSTVIKFRRLPVWTKEEIQIASKKAEDILNSIKIK